MASSLDKLVSYLAAENFSLLDDHFPEICSDNLQPLHQKVVHHTLISILMTNFRQNPWPVYKNGRTFSKMVRRQLLLRVFIMQQKFSKSLGVKISVVTTTFA